MSSLERDHVPSARPIAAKEVPLVDRTEEMNVLKEAVYRAVHGEGGLVFVHGEAGIGKTRLVRELGAYARSRGVQVLYGRCPALFRMDGVPPYVLWKEIIKDYLGECTPEQLNRVIGFYPAEVAKLVPDISQRLRAFPQSFPISPEQEQNRLFEAVSQFVTNISKETPLLVVLDDLQWTDPSSLLLLHYLARGVQKTPLLLLGAYCSTDIDSKHPLSPVLSELNRERLPQSVSLKRMSLNDISEMIKHILEQDNVPEEFCELVYEKTRGNPFFAEEVINSLKEEGVIYREEKKWKTKEVSEIEFPETVKNVVKARLGRLDDECQNVLTLASLVGNDFTLEAMCAVSGIEKGELLELMDKLFKTGLIKERVIRGEGICSFADILVRDVVYEEISPLKRKELHGVVGCALEQVYAKKIDEHFGELASHFLEGGDKDKALDYFLKAGEKATKIYANAEGASYFESALRLLEEKESDIQEKAGVLDKLGDVKKLLGEYDACMKYWNESLQLFMQMGGKETVARLHRKTANVLWSSQGDAEKAKTHHNEALKILQKEPKSGELASLFEDMAHFYLGTDVARARSWAEKAVELAEEFNDYEVIANSYMTLGSAIGQTGAHADRKKAVEYREKALKIALDNDFMDAALRAYSYLGDYVTEEGFKLFEKGYELAKKAGDVRWVSSFGTDLADAYSDMGDMNKSVSLLEESVALDRKAGDVNHLSYSLDELGWNYGVLGEWDKCERHFKEALSLTQKAQDNMQVAYTFWIIGWFYGYQKEEFVKAKEQFERAVEICERTGAETSARFFKGFIIWACIELGEIEKAKNLLDKLPKSSSKVRRDYWLLAKENSLRGMLFRAQKNWKESIKFFEKWLQEFEAFGARRWNAHWFAVSLYEYACVYLDRDQEGDRKKAHDLLSQVLEIFQKMGAKKDIEKVEAKLLYVETGKVTLVPRPAELVRTGYADLDRLLCGGLLSSSAVVLTSSSCNERNSLIKSFLKTGAEKGEVTFYFTIDPSLAKNIAELHSNFYLFVCNPQAEAIVKSSPNIFTLKGVENLTDISIALTSAMHKLDPSTKGPRRICIGLISDLLLQHHAVQTRRWLTGLISELRSNGFTTLAMMDPEMHPSQEVRAVLDLFEGEINICEKETEDGSEKFLKVKRMANQKYLKDELLLKEEAMQK